MKHLEEVIINYDKKLMEANAEIERLNNVMNEIYTKALDTSITSLDLRDYIINNLRSSEIVK